MQIKIFVTNTLLDSPNQLEELEKIKFELIKIFGGLNESDMNTGYWVNENGKTEKDSVVTWELLTDKQTFQKNKQKFEELMRKIKKVTKQKTQLYTINPKIKPIDKK